MISILSSLPASFAFVLARGRGIARLIEGLWEGDLVSWGIIGVIALFFGGKYFYQRSVNNAASTDEPKSTDGEPE